MSSVVLQPIWPISETTFHARTLRVSTKFEVNNLIFVTGKILITGNTQRDRRKTGQAQIGLEFDG